MATTLSKKAIELLKKPVLAHVVTLMKDGLPQVTPVWVDTDGEYVLVNTAEGRLKTRNVRRNPHVALSVVDAADNYVTLQVQGKVVDIITAGADAHIDKMAKKYLGKDTYPFRRSSEVRLILKIKPERVGGSVAQA